MSSKDKVRHNYGFRFLWKTIKWLVVFVLLIILFLIAVDVNLGGLFGESPGYEDLQNPPEYVASEAVSSDGEQLIGKFYLENRSPVDYEDIDPKIIRALISTEDARFYEHNGVDIRGLVAAIKDMALGRARGASTITQQLAKNLFSIRKGNLGVLGKTPGMRLVVAKAKEWIVAFKLEQIYSKEQILEMYLNTVDFGNNTFGIKTACKVYFAADCRNVTYEQAATLIGLLKATSTYNPRTNYERSLERRNTVLQLMYDQGAIVFDGEHCSEEELDSLLDLPITLASTKTGQNTKGLAPYFREAILSEIQQLYKTGKIAYKLDPYRDGLKIYTTLDTRLQHYAEEAVRQHLNYLQSAFRSEWGNEPCWRDEKGRVVPNFIEKLAKKTSHYNYLVGQYGEGSDSIDYYLRQPHPGVRLYGRSEPCTMSTMDSIRYMVSYMHCGFVAIEPNTREVKAWVGDVDFDHWKYDKVTAKRQPGSTFKLFVYTEAMRQGFKPTDKMKDEPHAYDAGGGATWTPRNAGGGYSGASIPLRQAFAKSINSIAVELGVQCGISNVIRTAHDMGIKSELSQTAPTCLGASDVCLLEMANAYCTVANDGVATDPILIKRIEDMEGNIIYEARNQTTQAIPERIAAMMQRLLQAGTEPGGTSARIWSFVGENPACDLGGKTGTTNNNSDAWYMGVTPGLVAGVWVGGEYRSVHFRSGALGQGARAAMPVWGYFLSKVLADKRFPQYRRRFTATATLDSTMWGRSVDTVKVEPIKHYKPDTTMKHIETEPIDEAIPAEEYEDEYLIDDLFI